METKNSRGIIMLVVILSLLVIGLGGFIVYDKVLKKTDNLLENNNNNNNGLENTIDNAYSILMSDICPSNGDCSKKLNDIVLGENTYEASVQLYDEGNEKTDYITLNNKTLDIYPGFIRFIAVMNKEYLVVGTNMTAPADVYSLRIFDKKNLNLVENLNTYLQGRETFDLTRDILDNNTTLLYYDCTMEEVVADSQNRQNLTTYSIKFANGTFVKTQTNVVNNTFCTAEMP